MFKDTRERGRRKPECGGLIACCRNFKQAIRSAAAGRACAGCYFSGGDESCGRWRRTPPRLEKRELVSDPLCDLNVQREPPRSGDVSFSRFNTLKMKSNVKILPAAEPERRDERRSVVGREPSYVNMRLTWNGVLSNLRRNFNFVIKVSKKTQPLSGNRAGKS